MTQAIDWSTAVEAPAAPAPPPERVWSPQQQAVFAAVEDTAAKHLVVEALAGTGKSTTIEEAIYHTTEGQSILVCAFNASIAKELSKRIPSSVATCSTLHSFGLRAVTAAMGRREIEKHVVADLAKECIPDPTACKARQEARAARGVISRIVSAAKNTLTRDPSTLDEVCDLLEIDFPGTHSRREMIRIALQIVSKQLAASTGPIDFEDMIWLPIARALPLRTFDWIFVDETQDLNAAQLEMVIRVAGDHGRICAIGDRKQAIYGFRGADRAAIPRMVERLKATVLPLSVTFRCGRAIVAEVARIVPAFEARPDAHEGAVRHSTVQACLVDARPGDFVVSRLNAPLVSLCFRMLAAGTRATIKGRDIGSGLAAWVRKTGASSIEELRECINRWEEKEVKRLDELDRDTQNITDRAECLRYIAVECDDTAGVLERLEELFRDDDDPATVVTLSSTHRAKGLEADRVWLLRDTYTQSRSKIVRGDNGRRIGRGEKPDWARGDRKVEVSPGEEESNIYYVALTRAKHELIFTHGFFAQESIRK